MSSGRAVPYFYGKFRFRNWNCRYLNYFRFRWWKSDTSAFPYWWGRRQIFPSRLDRTRGAKELLTKCLSSIPAICPFTNDSVCRLSQLPIRLLKQTNYKFFSACVSTGRSSDSNGASETRFSSENFVSRGFRCSPKATDKPNVAVNIWQFWYRIYVQSRLPKWLMRVRLLLTSHNGKSRDSAI